MRRPFLLLTLAAGLTAGCGDKLSPVNGTVTYDGAPVDGATVVFITESGSKQATGRTDSSGKFSLEYNNGPGIPSGTYKVMVTRVKVVEGTPVGDPTKLDKSYLEKMKSKEIAKSAGGGGPGGGPVSPMPGGKGEKKADAGDLPGVYSSPSTTPLTVTVPPAGPVELKLEKK